VSVLGLVRSHPNHGVGGLFSQVPRLRLLFVQSHLPNRCVTVRPPPYVLHTLVVNLGPQSASLVPCFLLLDRQARQVPVCTASRPRISWRILPLWGQDPTGRGSAAQSVKPAAHVHPTFIRGGLLGSATLGSVMSGARPLGVARSLE
jgi:hypothetical protein